LAIVNLINGPVGVIVVIVIIVVGIAYFLTKEKK